MSTHYALGRYSNRSYASGATPTLTLTPAAGEEVVLFSIVAQNDVASQVVNVKLTNTSGARTSPSFAIGNETLFRDYGAVGTPFGTDNVVFIELITPSAVGRLSATYISRERA